jgi:hypothetical protein
MTPKDRAEYYREFDNTHRKWKRQKNRKAHVKHREANNRLASAWYYANREQNKEKIHARALAKIHIPLGSNCVFCGTTKRLLRHHWDYSKPLEIITVCRSCHGFLHIIVKKIETEPFDKRLFQLLFGKIQQ